MTLGPVRTLNNKGAGVWGSVTGQQKPESLPAFQPGCHAPKGLLLRPSTLQGNLGGEASFMEDDARKQVLSILDNKEDVMKMINEVCGSYLKGHLSSFAHALHHMRYILIPNYSRLQSRIVPWPRLHTGPLTGAFMAYILSLRSTILGMSTTMKKS